MNEPPVASTRRFQGAAARCSRGAPPRKTGRKSVPRSDGPFAVAAGIAAAEGVAGCTTGATRPGYIKPFAYTQLKLKLILIRSASTRLDTTSWRSQLSNKITEPAVAG